jgi:hypothetical protein
MRYFTGLLFLGSGEHSVRDVDLLKQRLKEAVTISGGLQQSSQGMPEDHDEMARQQSELEDAARDIVAALLGRRVTFGEKLPYPPDSEPLRLYWEKLQTKWAGRIRT